MRPYAPPIQTPTKRRISADHFAYFRAVLIEDVSPAKAAQTYLPEVDGIKEARDTFAWIRGELLMAVSRSGDRRTARLLRLGRIALPRGVDLADAPPSQPSLEEFATTYDPDTVLGEDDLIAAYLAEYPPTDKPVGETGGGISRKRLRRRQIDALQRLEGILVDYPQLQDYIAGWLHPKIAFRLHAAGIATLDDLVNFCNVHGNRWWRHIDRLGEVRAARVVHWLEKYADSLRYSLSPRALSKQKALKQASPKLFVRQPLSSVAPLEALTVPDVLDGSAGANRAPQDRNKTGATNDFDAVSVWLRGFKDKSHTWRAYRTHAERLLLWAIFAQGKPLSSLTIEDVRLYRSFLLNPQPAEMWIGPHGAERWSPTWRPFTGPLSDSSCKMAIAVVRSMCAWLTEHRYLDSNPFFGQRVDLSETHPASDHADLQDRSLSTTQWRFLLNEVYSYDAAATSANNARARFMLLLGCLSGMRVSEIAKATIQDLKHFQRDDDSGKPIQWHLRVLGKRGKWRRIPMPNALIDALQDYLRSRGFDCPFETLVTSKHPIPLIGRLPLLGSAPLEDPHAPLAASSLGEAYKKLFERAAQVLMPQDLHAANALAKASAHWLRHTHASHSIRLGTPVATARENLGHASINTTSLYTHIDMEERHREMEAFAEKFIYA